MALILGGDFNISHQNIGTVINKEFPGQIISRHTNEKMIYIIHHKTIEIKNINILNKPTHNDLTVLDHHPLTGEINVIEQQPNTNNINTDNITLPREPQLRHPLSPQHQQQQQDDRDVERRECFRCGRRGHIRKNCRYPSKQCYCCKKYGHISRCCWYRKKKVCYNCQGLGHLSIVCKKRKKKCNYCHRSGHIEKFCWFKEKEERKRKR